VADGRRTAPRTAATGCWPECSRFLRTVCGLARGLRPLTCRLRPHYTLKRNSTTSPSCMT
jgi:hypothetical protein